MQPAVTVLNLYSLRCNTWCFNNQDVVMKLLVVRLIGPLTLVVLFELECLQIKTTFSISPIASHCSS